MKIFCRSNLLRNLFELIDILNFKGERFYQEHVEKKTIQVHFEWRTFLRNRKKKTLCQSVAIKKNMNFFTTV